MRQTHPHPCYGWVLGFDASSPSRTHGGLRALPMIPEAGKEAGNLSGLKPMIRPFGSLSKPRFLVDPHCHPPFSCMNWTCLWAVPSDSMLFCLPPQKEVGT